MKEKLRRLCRPIFSDSRNKVRATATGWEHRQLDGAAICIAERKTMTEAAIDMASRKSRAQAGGTAPASTKDHADGGQRTIHYSRRRCQMDCTGRSALGQSCGAHRVPPSEFEGGGAPGRGARRRLFQGRRPGPGPLREQRFPGSAARAARLPRAGVEIDQNRGYGRIEIGRYRWPTSTERRGSGPGRVLDGSALPAQRASP